MASWRAIWPSDVTRGHVTTITREIVLTVHRYSDDGQQRAQSAADAVSSGRSQQRTQSAAGTVSSGRSQQLALSAADTRPGDSGAAAWL